MNLKLTVSLIAILFAVVLTAGKFVFYYMSGSLAVLSEAWHSFSDIATSLLVFFSIRRSLKAAGAISDGRGATENPPEKAGMFGKLRSAIQGVHPELMASFLIGLFLFFVAVSVIWKILKAPAAGVSHPLMVGIIFLIFSAGSYFLYRFKTTAGRNHGSVALVTDGVHSLADMVVAMLTGFSLILYHLGINVDRITGIVIAILILSFSVETLVKVITSYVRKDSGVDIEYRLHGVVKLIWKKETWDWLGGHGASFVKSVSSRFKSFAVIMRLLKWGLGALVLLALSAYMSTSLYRVNPDEEAIVERFGSPVHGQRTEGPGLHLKLPWPVDRVKKINMTKIRELNLGNISGTDLPLLWTVEHGNEIHFISGDNNFFNPYVVVHYRVKSAFAYSYGHSKPDKMLEYVSYKVLSNTFASMMFYDVVMFRRGEWEMSCRHAIQKEIDALHSGIEIVNLLVKDIHPPLAVSESFEEVIAAYQEKLDLENQAIGYRNITIPAARVMAYNEEAGANAYVNEEMKTSEGDARRYLLKLEAYKTAKRVIRKQAFFESMNHFLEKSEKILIDPGSGVEDIWVTKK